MEIEFIALPTAQVRAIKNAGRDAYGNPLERKVSDGHGTPCRHCLCDVPAGEGYLVLAHRPFKSQNPYAETGPIFLCEADCTAPAPSGTLPPMLTSESYILRGYSADERIVYGSGGVVVTNRMTEAARALFADPQIAFADLRSAANNCFQCRVRRA